MQRIVEDRLDVFGSTGRAD
jgi:hypothetical protein